MTAEHPVAAPRRSRIVMVGGGVRSGKSAYALALAQRLGQRCAYIATAEARDDEMRERARAHREERGDAFTTFEEPYGLCAVLETCRAYDVAVIDCLTLWLSNRLLRGESESATLEALDLAVSEAKQRGPHLVIVTNEVGMGIVPEHSLGRAFRDLAGRAHQRIVAQADEVYFAALGMVMRLRPGPVEVVSPVALTHDP